WGHYEQILAHYYTGIHIRDSSGNRLTPTHRWNPLIVNFGTPDNTPPIMCVGWPYTFTLTIQNTGTGNWGSSYKLSYRWRAGSTWINPPPGAGVSTGNVAPGDEVTLTLSITPLDTGYDTLVIDMRGCSSGLLRFSVGFGSAPCLVSVSKWDLSLERWRSQLGKRVGPSWGRLAIAS
ncbi:MAG: hypothetical protein ACUVV0_13340, partial [Anaerolineae bacterium]